MMAIVTWSWMVIAGACVIWMMLTPAPEFWKPMSAMFASMGMFHIFQMFPWHPSKEYPRLSIMAIFFFVLAVIAAR